MFEIVVDTREKKPWTLRSKLVAGTICEKLDTGDYTVKGMEDIITIDRKASCNEIATNITTKRFHNELERMKDIEHSFLLLEFSVDDIRRYPEGSDVPKYLWKKIRVKGPYLLKKIMELPTKYGVHVMFCGDRDNAELMAIHLLKHAYEEHVATGDVG